MRANKIMSWKIMDVKIWFDCISYASWLCEEKEKLNKLNRCVKRKWEWKDPEDGKNEMKRKIRNGMTLQMVN